MDFSRLKDIPPPSPVPERPLPAWKVYALQPGLIIAGTLTPLPTEPLSIPQLNLSGLLPEQQNAVVKLDLTSTTPAPGGGAAADFTAWPEFHNGVAAGEHIIDCSCSLGSQSGSPLVPGQRGNAPLLQ